MKIEWKPSLKLFSITLAIISLIYWACFLPAFGFDEGTNPAGEICYRIIQVISSPLSFLHLNGGGWTLFFLIAAFNLMIWAAAISITIKTISSLLKRGK
jgi:hypothetical protein